MLMTLMMCLVGITSYSQDIVHMERDIWENKKEIDFKLEESSNYLIKSSNQSIGAGVAGVITTILSVLVYTDIFYGNKTSDGQDMIIGMGTVLSIGGSAITLGLGIS